jgi:dynein heavy chain
MNSVMDDNKILTLASNERIPLKPHMRMIFEIRDLKFATPATVSRAGILYISDEGGVQWKSYVESWIANNLQDEQPQVNLQKLFDRFVEPSLAFLLEETANSSLLCLKWPWLSLSARAFNLFLRKNT